MNTQAFPQEPLDLGLPFIQEGSLHLDALGAAGPRLMEPLLVALGDLSLHWMLTQ